MIDAGTAAHDGDYREECFAMLAGVLGRMCRRRGAIDDIEAALIDEAIAAAWDEAGNAADLGTVRKHLAGRDDRRATDMATALGPWCPGGAMGRLFAGGDTPELDAALTVFEPRRVERKGRRPGRGADAGWSSWRPSACITAPAQGRRQSSSTRPGISCRARTRRRSSKAPRGAPANTAARWSPARRASTTTTPTPPRAPPGRTRTG